jgi:hypothetical protein
MSVSFYILVFLTMYISSLGGCAIAMPELVQPQDLFHILITRSPYRIADNEPFNSGSIVPVEAQKTLGLVIPRVLRAKSAGDFNDVISPPEVLWQSDTCISSLLWLHST